MTQLAAKLQTRLHVAKDRMFDERGATAVEYGLLVALIAAVIVAVVKVVGSDVNNAFEKVNAALP